MKHYIKNIGISNLPYANNIASGELYEFFDDTTFAFGVNIGGFRDSFFTETGISKDIVDSNIEYYQDTTLISFVEFYKLWPFLHSLLKEVSSTSGDVSYSYPERSKLSNIALTQLVDLDTLESDVATNNAKETNVTTDLSIANVTNSNLDVASSDGTNATLPSASVTTAGLLTGTDKTKLDSIASNAEVNVNADWDSITGDTQILNKPTDLTELSLHSVTELNDVTSVGSGAIITTTERGKLGNITITNPVDLDTLESDVATNNTKETNITTDLSIANVTNSNLDVASSDGANATLPSVTTTAAGLLTGTDKTKLDSIASNADVNVNADWDSITGDTQILNKPTDLTELSLHNITELSDVTNVGSGAIITAAERGKLSDITITQLVDLDTLESDVATNNAKETNVTTDLSIGSKTPTSLNIISSDGGDAVIPSVNITEAGLMPSTDKVKLDNVYYVSNTAEFDDVIENVTKERYVIHIIGEVAKDFSNDFSFNTNSLEVTIIGLPIQIGYTDFNIIGNDNLKLNFISPLQLWSGIGTFRFLTSLNNLTLNILSVYGISLNEFFFKVTGTTGVCNLQNYPYQGSDSVPTTYTAETNGILNLTNWYGSNNPADLVSPGIDKYYGTDDTGKKHWGSMADAIINAGLVQTLSKTLTLEAPTASDNITFFRTDVAISVQEIIAISTGTTPSTTYQLKHSLDRSVTGNFLTSGEQTTTSTTTGDIATLGDSTIPANSWVWLETTAASGTDVVLTIDIRYTED